MNEREIYYAMIQLTIIAKKILFLGFLILYFKNIINHLKEFQERKDVDGIWFGIWFMKLNFHIFAFPILLFIM